MQRWLDVEVALVECQAELGLVPPEHADAIARAADIEKLDQDVIARAIRATGHSLVGLLRALEQGAGREAATSVHFGATTQDIQDTAQALEIRDVLDRAERDLEALMTALRPLALAHRATLMVGRTHARAALPTTFGLKVAGWIDELCRHRERLQQARPRLLVAQLAGGVGTMASFGEHGPELLARFAARLGLGVPLVGWHAIRDRIGEFGCTLGLIAATMARIADEIRTLGRPEFDELEEAWSHGQIGSSTMPHKRNPEICEQVVVLARLARAQVPVLLDAMVVEHERDGRTLRLEWPAIAELSHYTLAALAMTSDIVKGLRVHEETMARHAREVGDLICSEAIMLALGNVVGKGPSYDRIYRLSQDALSRRVPLIELLEGDPEVRLALGSSLAGLVDPAQYTGAAAKLVEAVVDELDRRLAPHHAQIKPFVARHREAAMATP